jgi:hypothetical protein
VRIAQLRLREAAHLVLREDEVAEQLVVELGLGAGELGVGDDEVIRRPAVELLRIAAYRVEAAAFDVTQDLSDAPRAARRSPRPSAGWAS